MKNKKITKKIQYLKCFNVLKELVHEIKIRLWNSFFFLSWSIKEFPEFFLSFWSSTNDHLWWLQCFWCHLKLFSSILSYLYLKKLLFVYLMYDLRRTFISTFSCQLLIYLFPLYRQFYIIYSSNLYSISYSFISI